MFQRLALLVITVLLLASSCAGESSEQRSDESLDGTEVSDFTGSETGMVPSGQRNLSQVLPPDIALNIVDLLDAAVEVCDIFGDGIDPLGCAPAVWSVCYSVNSLWESSRLSASSREAADLAVLGILGDVCDSAFVADYGELLGSLARRYREQFFTDAFRTFEDFWFQGLADSFLTYRKEFREDGSFIANTEEHREDGSDIVSDKLVEFWDAVRNFANRVWIWNSERLSQEFDLYDSDLLGDENSASDQSIHIEGDSNSVKQLCNEARRATRENRQNWEKKIDICLKSSNACYLDTEQPNKICTDLSAVMIREHLWQNILKDCATVENPMPVLTEDDCYSAGIEFCQHEGIPDYFFDTPDYIESYISEYSEWVIGHKICKWVGIQ